MYEAARPKFFSDAFIGSGTNLKTLRRICADAPPVCVPIEQMHELSKRGGNWRSEQRLKDFKRNDNAFEKPARGDAASYALRRLRDKRPDLHRKVMAGEIFGDDKTGCGAPTG